MSVHFYVILLIFLAGLVYLAHIIATYAQKRGLSYGAIFVLGLITSPIIQYIVVLIMESNVRKDRKEPVSYSNTRKCPFCAEEIKEEAVICRFCNRDVPTYIEPIEMPATEPETSEIYPFECDRCGIRYQDEATGCPECKLI